MSLATLQSKTLRHDINILLTLFNQIDKNNQSHITQQSLIKILQSIQIDSFVYEQYLNSSSRLYQFDDLLSILGQIQVPQQPSVYVLSFVKILASYRKQILSTQDINQFILQDARTIDAKINKISNRQIQRRKSHLLQDHYKIYNQMAISQQKQYLSFEEQWKNYIQQFQYQSYQKLRKTKKQKLKQLVFQSSKLEQRARKTYLIVSPKLRQLNQRKKWLVKQGKYQKALKLNNQMNQQKRRLSLNYEKTINNSVNKRLESMRKKNQSVLQHLQEDTSVSKNKILAKKKQGQNIMKIRMKSLREQAQKKLNQHLRNQMGRLKSSLHIASKV